jgi:hypothetical protein
VVFICAYGQTWALYSLPGAYFGPDQGRSRKNRDHGHNLSADGPKWRAGWSILPSVNAYHKTKNPRPGRSACPGSRSGAYELAVHGRRGRAGPASCRGGHPTVRMKLAAARRWTGATWRRHRDGMPGPPYHGGQAGNISWPETVFGSGHTGTIGVLGGKSLKYVENDCHLECGCGIMARKN